MTLTQLEYVLAVNKHRHFGKAASSCHVTQPTLSMQLHKLEEELEVKIFDRSKNPILPTQEGEAIIQQAKIIIQEQKKLLEILQEKQKELEGDFRLAVIPTLSPYLIPLFAKNFVNKFQKIHLIIHEHKTETILQLLEEDEIDAGLLATPLYNNLLTERVLYYEPFYLFIAPEHALLKRKEIHEEELDRNDIWLLNDGHCLRNQVLKLCSSEQKKIQSSIRFESGNLETLKNMVLQYSGYTVLPHMAIQQLSEKNKKLIRPFEKPVPTREISLVHRRSHLKLRAINTLIEEIKRQIPKELHTVREKDLAVITP